MTPATPIYDLDMVREAASKGHVFLQRSAQRHSQEMGYALDDVHSCIACLEVGDYRGVVEYNGIQFDVYCPRFRGPTGCVDELYVKLNANDRATVPQITVLSFHLQRKG